MSQSLPVSYVQVTAVERITPRMARITFTGDALADVMEDRPDQQMKLCFPRRQGAPVLPEQHPDDTYGMRWYEAYLAIPEAERPWTRGFTVRAYDRVRDEMTVDFVLHGDSGPASRWGGAARPGDVLGMVGPSSMYARPLPASDWLLLAGDATALPAIGTLLEALPAGMRAVAYVEVADGQEEQRLTSAADVTVHWVHGPGRTLADAVRAAELPGDAAAGAAWLAGESGTVRALRRHLVEERGLARPTVEFSGYWRRALTQDDAPTEEDLAWAQERAGGF